MFSWRFIINREDQTQRTTTVAHAQTEVADAPKPESQRQGHGRLLRVVFRFVLLSMLTIIGLYAVYGASGLKERHPAPLTHQAIVHGSGNTAPIAVGGTPSRFPSRSEAGAVAQSAFPADFCFPTDISCLLGQAGKWIAQSLFGVFQPLIDGIDQSSLNFITQTPVDGPSGMYQNPAVMGLSQWAVGVVYAATAFFIVVGGYTIMVSRHTGRNYEEVLAFLPRLALAVLAATFSMHFTKLFIDLENALCLDVVHLAGLTLLTNITTDIFQHGDILGAGLLAFALAIILGVMDLLLAWQMLVRLALLLLLIVLAPLALFCLALRQTQDWARLWMTTFAATVFVQFFQVVLLALGSMLVSFTLSTDLLHLDRAILTLLSSTAVFYLVLKIPGMLRIYALRPVAQAGNVGPFIRDATGVAVRLASL